MNNIHELVATTEGRRALSIASPVFFDSYYLGMHAAGHRNNWLNTVEDLHHQAKEKNDKKKISF